MTCERSTAVGQDRMESDDEGPEAAAQKEAELDAAARAAVEEARSTTAIVVVPEETFSDIDDDEIDGYMATAEEADLKEVIWGEMNKCGPSKCLPVRVPTVVYLKDHSQSVTMT